MQKFKINEKCDSETEFDNCNISCKYAIEKIYHLFDCCNFDFEFIYLLIGKVCSTIFILTYFEVYQMCNVIL